VRGGGKQTEKVGTRVHGAPTSGKNMRTDKSPMGKTDKNKEKTDNKINNSLRKSKKQQLGGTAGTRKTARKVGAHSQCSSAGNEGGRR